MEDIFDIAKLIKSKNNEGEKKITRVSYENDFNNVVDELVNNLGNVEKDVKRKKNDDTKLVIDTIEHFGIGGMNNENNILDMFDSDFKKSSMYKEFKQSFSVLENVRIYNNWRELSK